MDDLPSKVTGCRPGLSHRCAHTVGLGRRTTMKYVVLLLISKASNESAAAHVCLGSFIIKDSWVFCTKGNRWLWPALTHTHRILGLQRSIGTQRAAGPEKSKPVQTTSLHPYLTILFNELSEAQCIPQLICTGPSVPSGTEPKSLNRGQRSPERPQQCFLSLRELTWVVPHLGFRKRGCLCCFDLNCLRESLPGLHNNDFISKCN